MLHNVIRGQGASLLAILAYLFILGSAQPNSFLLIAFTCGFAFIAHLLTALHPLKSATVMKAVGSLKSMYCILGINFSVGSLALYIFWMS